MVDSVPLLVAAGAILVGFVLMVGLIAVVLLRIAGKLGRHGSVAGALYEGRVGRTYGEMETAPRGLAKVKLKVVDVAREPRAVGIEVHVNARLGYSMRAVRLTPNEAVRIAEALEALARG